MNYEDVVDLCSKLNLTHSEPYNTSSGANLSISCPLAPKTHTDSFDSNKSCSVLLVEDGPSLVRCHSISCAFKGTLSRMIRRAFHGQDEFKDIVSWVAQVEADTPEGAVSRSVIRSQSDKKAKDMSLARLLSRRVGRDDVDVRDESDLDGFDKSYHEYAATRDIDVQTYLKWGLCFDRGRERLVFPVRRKDGALVGMTGRTITGEGPKWFNYSGLNKSEYLYGEHLAQAEKPIILVEGPGDAVKADSVFADYNVMACMGSGLSDKQTLTIRKLRPSVVVIFGDGDAAGRMLTKQAALALVPLLVKIVKTPDGSDPGSLSAEASRNLVEEAEVFIPPKKRWKKVPRGEKNHR